MPVQRLSGFQSMRIYTYCGAYKYLFQSALTINACQNVVSLEYCRHTVNIVPKHGTPSPGPYRAGMGGQNTHCQ